MQLEVLTAFMSGVDVSAAVASNNSNSQWLPRQVSDVSASSISNSAQPLLVPHACPGQYSSIAAAVSAPLVTWSQDKKPLVLLPSSASTKSGGNSTQQKFVQRRRVLASILFRLRELVPLRDNNLHALAWKEEVLAAYNTACFVLGEPTTLYQQQPALFRSVAAQESSILVQFGGQGFSWLPELRRVFHVYPHLRPFVASCAAALTVQVQTMEAQMLGFYSHGFDLLQWLAPSDSVDAKTTNPPADYLISAPISYPMVCLTQLCHALIILRELNMPPRMFHGFIRAAIGHSQGIVAAVVLASSHSFADYAELSNKVMQYMFW